MANAFDKRQDRQGLWEVYDVDNERVVTVDGLPLAGLDAAEADDALQRLGSGRLSPDSSPATP